MPAFLRFVPAVLTFLAFAALTLAVRADGFIVVHPGPTPVPVPRGHFSFAPLEVSFHNVAVDIKGDVATTSVDQEFVNPNPQQLEGTYLFPLPVGAHIDKFSMDVNGKMQEAELLPADKARKIYEDIVRSAKDPALLEYVGRDTFKVRIFPIEANGKKRVKITYTQLLKPDTGLVEYVYPLNTEKFSARPLRTVSLKLTLESAEDLKSVYCPSHKVEIKRDGAKKAVVGFEDKNVRPDTDFKLIYSRETKNDVGINLLTYRNAPDEGYFMLLASPGMTQKEAKVQPKDVCLVLDTSGSMAGPKMEQAKKAMAFCLANLNEQDRFELIRFSTEADHLFEKLQPANKENVAKAQAYVDTLKPIGGTAIDEALQKALKLGKERGEKDRRPFVVIFLTDGQPTIGETRQDAILANVGKVNADGVRVFSFGIGTDLNTHLLDALAQSTKAFSQYVIPTEDIEVKLSNFYTKIKDPVLSDVSVAFTGNDVKATQIYPNAMPDLFKGEVLVVFGKYSGKGAGAVKVSGTINGEKREFAQDVNFADNDKKHEFIPRLWATRRVGWLLDEIRRNGEKAELKDEVVRLARAHGIVTPYTAYLILEDEARRNVPLAVRTMRELEADRPALEAAKAVYDATVSESRGERFRAGDLAVANANNLGVLKESENLQQSGQGYALDKGGSFGVSRGPATPAPSVTGGVAAGGGAGGQASRFDENGGGIALTPAPGAQAGEKLELKRQSDGSLAIRPAQPAEADARGQAQGQPSDAVAGKANKAADPALGYRASGNYAQQARVVRGRAFYQNGSVWTDASAASAKAELKRREVKFMSDDYFALLKDNADVAAWLALGNEVDFVLGDELIVVR